MTTAEITAFAVGIPAGLVLVGVALFVYVRLVAFAWRSGCDRFDKYRRKKVGDGES